MSLGCPRRESPAVSTNTLDADILCAGGFDSSPPENIPRAEAQVDWATSIKDAQFLHTS